MKITLEILFPLLLLVASAISIVLLIFDLPPFKKKEEPKKINPESYLDNDYGVFESSKGWFILKVRDVRRLEDTKEIINSGEWFEVMKSKDKDIIISEFEEKIATYHATEKQIL